MLKLEINAEGKLVLRGVTGETWAYIEEKRRALFDPDHRHWYLSRELFGDTVYLTVTPYEDKTDFLEAFDGLIAKFGLEVSPAAEHVVTAWRLDAENAKNNALRREEMLALEEKIDRLTRLCKEGCASCSYFTAIAELRDKRGVCRCGEKPVYLRETVFSPIREDKYYPHDGCKYLTGGKG